MVDKIALIEIQNRKILSTRNKGREKYYIPGGKREGVESDEETLIREIKEELNVVIVPDTIQYVGTFQAQSDAAKKGVKVKMTCYSADFTGVIQSSSEIEEIIWLDSKDLEVISEVDKKIFHYLNHKNLID